MPSEQVQGLAEAMSMLDRLPQAAQDELRQTLVDIGLDLLAAERRDVPKDTGFLYRNLTAVIDRLRLRVGLIGVAARSKSALRAARRSGSPDPRNYGDAFYGRFVNFGVRAQTVIVRRRKASLKRMRASQERLGRARQLKETWTMHVNARAAVPFITGQVFLQNRMAQRVADFWSRSLAKAGAR